ncbi:hypothetical protein BT63DRAFT_411601 [Microthyrium microscopicum]|uniref:Uncharacterized protein n=1 Tax=Microthyrium microscopicum TaxID=703497 RepID=A0A6A6ULI8_9PEZI|nr:hypothetical protein BT63DRAFT_411601 [Microthyrium microscopicum]
MPPAMDYVPPTMRYPASPLFSPVYYYPPIPATPSGMMFWPPIVSPHMESLQSGWPNGPPSATGSWTASSAGWQTPTFTPGENYTSEWVQTPCDESSQSGQMSSDPEDQEDSIADQPSEIDPSIDNVVNKEIALQVKES